ncbi:hypothetical protein [Promicromonospora umidemergens]|uniref:hypothetical protein n=1 Tax=Promicromonospora umidemergens TaxID=629679 RepID=UPI0020A2C683|nr:hypothetical protein [Promicromonospora umidemergens]
MSLAAAGLLAVGLAGCGAAADDTAPAAVPDAASETTEPGTAESKPAEPKTTEAKTAEMTQATFVERVGGAQESATTMHIESSYSGALAEAAGLAGATIPMDVDASDPESPRMSTSMDVQDKGLSMIVVDDTYYISVGEATDGKYVKATEKELMSDPAMSSLQSMSEVPNPRAQLEGFKDGIVSFEASGTDTVNGTEVDLYTLVLDPAKVTGPQVEQLDPEMVDAMGEMTAVYALDKSDRPARVAVTMTVDGQELISTAEFSRWGEDLAIEAPPADQIVQR